MTTLATDAPRVYEVNLDPDFDEAPAVATDIIYEGAAVGDNASGYARPLVAGDAFWGFAHTRCDNSTGAAGAKRVKLRQRGNIQLTVVGASAVTDKDNAVYASDDNTFTLSSTGNTQIGKVKRWVSGTTCVVAFEAVAARSV